MQQSTWLKRSKRIIRHKQRKAKQIITILELKKWKHQ